MLRCSDGASDGSDVRALALPIFFWYRWWPGWPGFRGGGRRAWGKKGWRPVGLNSRAIVLRRDWSFIRFFLKTIFETIANNLCEQGWEARS